MRRIFIMLSFLVMLCLMAIGVWISGYKFALSSALQERKEKDALPKEESVGLPQKISTTPMIFDLPMQFACFGDNEFSPCYVGRERKTLYRWKGIKMPSEKLPDAYKQFPSGIHMLNASDFSEIVTVEGPVNYREINGEYRPGYLFRPTRYFYEWKGVVLRRENVFPRGRDGQNSVVELDAVSRVIEIDIPAHLKEQPSLWRKP